MPYRAYAYLPIQGAVLMSCRRREYREATHEQLAFYDGEGTGDGVRGWGKNYESWVRQGVGRVHGVLDTREGAEAILLRREERRNISGPREYRRSMRIRAALESIPSEDAELVSLVFFEYADIDKLEQSAPGTKRRLTRAVGRLKRTVLAH